MPLPGRQDGHATVHASSACRLPSGAEPYGEGGKVVVNDEVGCSWISSLFADWAVTLETASAMYANFPRPTETRRRLAEPHGGRRLHEMEAVRVWFQASVIERRRRQTHQEVVVVLRPYRARFSDNDDWIPSLVSS